jgi:transcriptional regulator with GAF, ATPase, and Fis domain
MRSLRAENRELREALGRRYEFGNIIGRSPAMQEIFATVVRVAPTRATVLLAGESGVGKDMIARALHQHSPRHDRPFVKINCTALPENLMESELFGYEKGAFTGANITKPGKFEQADTGTVFLDEIGDVPASVQVKLLQERGFRQVATRPVTLTCGCWRLPMWTCRRRERDLPRGSVLPAECDADQLSRRCAKDIRRWPSIS